MHPESLAIASGSFPDSTIHLMPDLLRWGEASRAGLDTVYDTYVAFVGQALGYALSDLKRKDRDLADHLVGQLQTVPAPDFLRVILAPDFTYRLFWRRPDRIQRVSEYLNQALHVEGVIGGREKAGCEAWSALGDIKVLRTGEIAHGVKIPGLPPLDLDSPNVTSAEFQPDPADDGVQFHPLSNDVRPMVIDRMATAWQQISATSTLVADFAAKFVQVIVLRSDNERSAFSGGSSHGCIGRVVIDNPHLDFVSDVRLADALVHEAIHALLYMQVYRAPWGTSHGAFAQGVRVVSPWTGAALPVTSFLQACFVWYGLLHFWRLAHEAKTFGGAQEAHVGMTLALAGFLGSPLLDALSSEDRKIVSDDVSSAIQTMQARVKACYG
jgi:hypothetical protein